MEQRDKELVAGVVRGEQEAFAVLFQRYRAVVQGHLGRIIRDAAAADDLTQEVFLRLWHRAEQWKGQAAFRSWLLRIATNLAFNYLRTVKRRREQPIQFVSATEEDEDESLAPGWMIDASTLGPDEALAQSEQRHLLQRFVDQLPEEKQEVFRLIYDAHMETREAAAELGIPEGTVKSRLHHARRQIARSWQELDSEGEDI
jgi:RNA polymerase sigma-70 factor, ECF subfamily